MKTPNRWPFSAIVSVVAWLATLFFVSWVAAKLGVDPYRYF